MRDLLLSHYVSHIFDHFLSVLLAAIPHQLPNQSLKGLYVFLVGVVRQRLIHQLFDFSFLLPFVALQLPDWSPLYLLLQVIQNEIPIAFLYYFPYQIFHLPLDHQMDIEVLQFEQLFSALEASSLTAIVLLEVFHDAVLLCVWRGESEIAFEKRPVIDLAYVFNLAGGWKGGLKQPSHLAIYFALEFLRNHCVFQKAFDLGESSAMEGRR